MNIRSKIFGGGWAAEDSPIVQAKQRKGASADAGLHSIPVVREAIRTSDTREADRHRLPDEQVRITHDGQGYEVQLVNLSGGGAMVEGDVRPLLWDRVDLQLGENGTIECAVRWIKGARVGLEFAHETRLECSAETRAAVLREVIAKSFPDVELEVPATEEAEDTQDEGAENRQDRRHPLIWSAVIHHDHQSTPVRLRNISERGALIECSAALRVGAEPMLDLGEAGAITAKVSWVVGDSAGLKFDTPFDLTQLARSRPEIAPARWNRPGYLQPGTAADSPWAAEWGRMSLSELRDELEGYMKR